MVSSHCVSLTINATNFRSCIDYEYSRSDSVFTDNDVTILTTRSPGSTEQSWITTRRNLRLNNQWCAIQRFDVDFNRSVECRLTCNCDSGVERYRRVKRRNEVSYIFIFVLRIQEFCTFQECLLTSNSVNFLVTDIQVTIGVQTRVEDDTAVFTLRLSIEVLFVSQDHFLAQWETSGVVTRTESKVFKRVVTRSCDRWSSKFDVELTLCWELRVTRDRNQSILRSRGCITFLCCNRISRSVSVSSEQGVANHVNNCFLRLTTLGVVNSNETMDIVVSSRRCCRSVKNSSISYSSSTINLEPKRIVLIVLRIQEGNRLRELEVSEVLTNTRSSWEWRDVTTQAGQVVDTILLVCDTLLQGIDVEDVETIFKVSLIFDRSNVVCVLTSVISDCITRSNCVDVRTFYSVEIVSSERLISSIRITERVRYIRQDCSNACRLLSKGNNRICSIVLNSTNYFLKDQGILTSARILYSCLQICSTRGRVFSVSNTPSNLVSVIALCSIWTKQTALYACYCNDCEDLILNRSVSNGVIKQSHFHVISAALIDLSSRLNGSSNLRIKLNDLWIQVWIIQGLLLRQQIQNSRIDCSDSVIQQISFVTTNQFISTSWVKELCNSIRVATNWFQQNFLWNQATLVVSSCLNDETIKRITNCIQVRRNNITQSINSILFWSLVINTQVTSIESWISLVLIVIYQFYTTMESRQNAVSVVGCSVGSRRSVLDVNIPQTTIVCSIFSVKSQWRCTLVSVNIEVNTSSRRECQCSITCLCIRCRLVQGETLIGNITYKEECLIVNDTSTTQLRQCRTLQIISNSYKDFLGSCSCSWNIEDVSNRGLNLGCTDDIRLILVQIVLRIEGELLQFNLYILVNRVSLGRVHVDTCCSVLDRSCKHELVNLSTIKHTRIFCCRYRCNFNLQIRSTCVTQLCIANNNDVSQFVSRTSISKSRQSTAIAKSDGTITFDCDIELKTSTRCQCSSISINFRLCDERTIQTSSGTSCDVRCCEVSTCCLRNCQNLLSQCKVLRIEVSTRSNNIILGIGIESIRQSDQTFVRICTCFCLRNQSDRCTRLQVVWVGVAQNTTSVEGKQGCTGRETCSRFWSINSINRSEYWESLSTNDSTIDTRVNQCNRCSNCICNINTRRSYQLSVCIVLRKNQRINDLSQTMITLNNDCLLAHYLGGNVTCLNEYCLRLCFFTDNCFTLYIEISSIECSSIASKLNVGSNLQEDIFYVIYTCVLYCFTSRCQQILTKFCSSICNVGGDSINCFRSNESAVIDDCIVGICLSATQYCVTRVQNQEDLLKVSFNCSCNVNALRERITLLINLCILSNAIVRCRIDQRPCWIDPIKVQVHACSWLNRISYRSSVQFSTNNTQFNLSVTDNVSNVRTRLNSINQRTARIFIQSAVGEGRLRILLNLHTNYKTLCRRNIDNCACSITGAINCHEVKVTHCCDHDVLDIIQSINSFIEFIRNVLQISSNVVCFCCLNGVDVATKSQVIDNSVNKVSDVSFTLSNSN